MMQGNLQSTGRPTDLALEGNGFFVLGSGTNRVFTRAGNFGLDANNRLVSTINGLSVMGWQADPMTGAVDNTVPIGPSSILSVPLGTMALARTTGHVVYQANLDSNTAVGDTVNTSFSVYDSQGNSHQVQMDFTKTGDNAWSWAASGPDIDAAGSTATGTLSFDENGQCLTPNINCSLALTTPGGATSPINFGVDMSATTQLAGDSSVGAVSQDGLSLGWLENFSIDKDGILTGGFSNGMTQVLGQVALANFINPAGLEKIGSSMFASSSNSGAPVVTTAGHAGCGAVASGSLELSNVNLAEEFANLIVTQRGFQANSRIITTADEMMQDLITLKR
jgi:flagellar hook protein FlgE